MPACCAANMAFVSGMYCVARSEADVDTRRIRDARAEDCCALDSVGFEVEAEVVEVL